MRREICSMRIAEAAKRRRCVGAEGLACSFAELRPNERPAVIRETDKALVEGRVPKRGEQQTHGWQSHIRHLSGKGVV
jgi:hypothetical protein